MRVLRLIVTGMLGVSVVPQASAQTPAPTAAPPVTAFTHVAVIPMDRERVVRDQTVVVRGDRIVALGPSKQVPVPAGAVQVDGRGKYLIPGLADMHVHLGYGGVYDTPAVIPALLFALVANGVTTVRDMHSGGANDSASRLGLRQRVAAGELLGPRIYTAGDPDLRSPEAAAQSVRGLKADGYDFVKVSLSSATPRAMYDSIVGAARRVGLRVVGHVPQNVGVAEVLKAPFASTEHLYEYVEYLLGINGRWSLADDRWGMLFFPALPLADTAAWMQPGFRLAPARLRHLAVAAKWAGVWNTPTLTIEREALRRLSELAVKAKAKAKASTAEVPDSMNTLAPVQLDARIRVLRRAFEFKDQIVRALRDAGAGLLLGTDMPFNEMAIPGVSVHQELAALVAAGLTPYEALATGTRNVAAFLRTLDSTGTVAVGKRADLVLLRGNPLRAIRQTARPAGVMIGGRWLSRATIEARLDSLPEMARGLREAALGTER